MNTYESAAYDLIQAGFAAIPADARHKRPALKAWREFQNRIATDADMDAWSNAGAFRNGLAIVTGIVDDPARAVVVLDIDGEIPPRAGEWILRREYPTPICTTGSGGIHIYFRHPGSDVNLRNAVNLLPGVDFRGDGGFVFAPPSPHPSVSEYTWWTGQTLPECELPPLPDWLVKLLKAHGSWLKPDEKHSPARKRAPKPGRSNGTEPCRYEPIWTDLD